MQVGKGRQIATILHDNFCRGRRQHVWVSIASDLFCEVQRDLRDTRCQMAVINGQPIFLPSFLYCNATHWRILNDITI